MGDFIGLANITGYYQAKDLSRLSNADGSGALVNDDIVLNICINKAEALIKSYIQSRYELPFTTIPEVIKNLAVSLTMYFLQDRKNGLTAGRQQLYDNDIKTLTNIQKGIVVLDSVPGVNAFQTAETIDGIVSGTNDRDFIDLEGF